MMRDKLIVMVVLAWLIFGFSASALEYSPDCAEFSNKTTDWSRTLSVDKFDPSLGVLTGVKVSADACASQLFMLDSEDSEPQCWTVTTNAWLSAAMPDGTDFVLSLPEKTNQFCLSADLDEEPDFAGNDSFRFFIKECVKDERTYSDLANWIGPGKVDFKVVAKGITDVAGSSSFDQRVRTFANETICVTYYYEPCDDGLWCNGEETSNGLICLPGTPPDCSDNIDCTKDSCNEETDECEHSPDDDFCDDGKFCNGAETCDPASGCLPGTAPNCSDNIDCTIDSCNEETDKCEHSADDSKCDDGLWCNGAETCDPTKGCQPGTAPDCSDGIDCTIDSCNEDTDECEHSADDSKCDDDDACTIDSCDPLTGCAYEDVDCDDDDACTIDSCDPLTGCTYKDVDCDDGDACTIDSCDPLTGCTYEDVDCDDGDQCTEDSCDPAIGCIHTPIIPEAVDDSYGAIYGKTLTVSAAEGVLVNDVYDGSGTMTATLVTGPSSGTLSLNADGSFTYKPKTGFVGTVTFTYKACDGNCCSDPATVTIIVAKCPWTLRNDLYSAKCGEDKVVPASQGILANDPTAIAVIDPGSITINPVYGTIEVNEDGSFVYHAAEVIPSGTYVQFTYTATNGVCSASNSATAKIQIICPCR